MTDHARTAEQQPHEHQRGSDALLASILNMVTRMDEKLDSHMAHEEGEIEAINTTLNDHRDELNRRIDTFMQNVNGYMEKQADIEQAFLRTKDGVPDIHGHRSDHEERLTRTELWKQRREKWFSSAMEKAIWIVLAFICLAVWEAIKSQAKQ